MAEVKACKHLVDDIVALAHGELQHLDLLRSRTIIQGDILPVIKFLSLSCRLRRVDLVDDLEYIQHIASRYFSASRWRALPREANELADDLAGQAARHMLKRYLQNNPHHTLGEAWMVATFFVLSGSPNLDLPSVVTRCAWHAAVRWTERRPRDQEQEKQRSRMKNDWGETHFAPETCETSQRQDLQ